MNYKETISFVFLFSTILFSCNDGDEESLIEPTYVSKTLDSINIQIGSNSIIVPVHKIFPIPNNNFFEFYRIPTIALTNKGTVLVSCENRKIFSDSGEIDIVLARKDNNSDSWHISKIYQNEKSVGRSMNPQFLVDEESGRIFLFTCHLKNNNRFWTDQLSSDIDYVYKYSDDDGITWSKEYSLKDIWNNEYYEDSDDPSLFNKNRITVDNLWSNSIMESNYGIIPSCVKGIKLEDNTYLVPSIVVKNFCNYSCLLIYKEGRWLFSKSTPNIGDDECTVYIDNEGRIILDCRTLDKTRRKYCYDLVNDEFTDYIPSAYISNVGVSTEIFKYKGIYFMCFPNSSKGIREDLTLYGSRDGIEWKEITMLTKGNLRSYGYSSIAIDEHHFFVCYEAPDGIFVQDISNYKDLLRNSIIDEN